MKGDKTETKRDIFRIKRDKNLDETVQDERMNRGK
mgnify:CR=1 FL=1